MARTKSVQIQMKAILDQFDEKVNTVLKNAGRDVSQEAAEKLRNSSPRQSGSYASGWTVTEQDGRFVVHNATDYQLTHLLENGHVIENQYGVYGRTRPRKHIKPVETWANREFQRQIERGLSS